MGIFGALVTSVAGMRAQSFALENISGNIANSQTTAFKRVDSSFLDLIPEGTPGRQLAGSVTSSSRLTNTVQGEVQAASISTFMAINGEGFFAVQKPDSYTDNTPAFDGVDRYTRRGDFQLDKNGYLVNGAGYFLMGIPVDAQTGNLTGSVPSVLRFQNDFLPAQSTTSVSYRANLATYPKRKDADPLIAGSELLRPLDFTTGFNPVVLGTAPPPLGSGSFNGNNMNNKLGNPITGATLFNGAAGTNSLTSDFVAGNTITVNGNVFTFVNSGANATQLNITDDIDDLLTKINALTSSSPASTIAAGVLNLQSGTGSTLTMSSNNAAAFAALGFSGTVTVLRTGGGTIGTGQVTGQDNTTFLESTISGGAVTAYDVSGAPVNMQFRWAKIDSASMGAGHTDKWNLFYQTNTNASNTQVAWQNVNQDFSFLPNGQMNPPITALNLTNVNVNGIALGDVTMNFGSGGITQFADSNGNVQVNQIQQNGFPAGQLQSVSVSDRGRIVGNYSNGRNIDLAEITLATFNGANFLKRIDGGAFEATDEFGLALYGGGGRILGSSLEGSNTDIADEFTKLIVTQQAYSANTRVITTTNTMVQDLLNMLR